LVDEKELTLIAKTEGLMMNNIVKIPKLEWSDYELK
jgi:hypothetical protein